MSDMTPRQEREVSMAIKHLGRAMRAMSRADLPDLSDIDHEQRSSLYDFYQGVRLMGKASDALIDGVMKHQDAIPDQQ